MKSLFPELDDERVVHTTAARDIYSVSRLNQEAKTILEGHFPLIWIEGELSNLSQPASGHWYFTLKDTGAQVRCAMFKQRNRMVRFKPAEGAQVLLRGRVGLYEQRGEFQLLVETMEESGEGALRRAFEALKGRLAAEGLFETRHKKPLPVLPNQVGIITSATGAALQDILHSLKRRFPSLSVLVYPVLVQGEGAAEKIARMIQLACQRRECDVLILARGGGSLEDLWAFNEEIVARAIAAASIPIVSGIGHETDFTIADFVADHRAPTPSAAAELVSPDGAAWLNQFSAYALRLDHLVNRTLTHEHNTYAQLTRRLGHQTPLKFLENRAQRLDEFAKRVQRGMSRHLINTRHRMDGLKARFERHDPITRLTHAAHLLLVCEARLKGAMRKLIFETTHRLNMATRGLNTLSPLATLDRGYALISHCPEGGVISNAARTSPGRKIEARLAKGRLICKVEKISSK